MIKVLNLKKNLFKIYFFIFFLIIIIFLFKQICSTQITFGVQNINQVFYYCLDDVLPKAVSDKVYFTNIDLIETVLYSELPILDTSLYLNQKEDVVSYNNVSNDLTGNSIFQDSLDYASNTANTETIDSMVPNTYTNEFNGIQIKNLTDYNLTYDMLNPDELKINNENIIIFHTHTCESYTPTEEYQYEESGNFRTIDLERSVVKVGSVLTEYLKHYGLNVIHNKAYHDYPSYNGSYGRSLNTVQSILDSQPATDIIIDLHRDAISDSSYAPSVKINDEIVSQLMFVIGTDGSRIISPRLD